MSIAAYSTCTGDEFWSEDEDQRKPRANHGEASIEDIAFAVHYKADQVPVGTVFCHPECPGEGDQKFAEFMANRGGAKSLNDFGEKRVNGRLVKAHDAEVLHIGPCILNARV